MTEQPCQPPQPARPCLGCGAPLRLEGTEGWCAQCLVAQALRYSDDSLDEEEELISAAGLEGRTLGGYEIQETIAQGGMGIVFRARQAKPTRVVALKVISVGELATPRMVERFHNEARAAAHLEHPNIVPIYEVGEDRGWHFFSMRLMEGGTLADLIQRRPVNPEEAARLVLKIARAVEHAHQRGILHRDIKPTNILLSESGEPQLTDFGLAKLGELETGLTMSRAILGTPAYMSPEQASGKTREITTATDVYGLGAVFYEMLAGQPPFRAESAPALFRKIAEEEPGSADAWKQMERDLRVICQKCLEKDPQRRYATAGEVADEIERWLRREPILARPGGAAERAAKWVRRHPGRAVAFGTIAVAALILFLGWTVFTVRLGRSRAEAERNAAAATERLVASRMSEAARLAAAGDGHASLLSLTAAKRDAATNTWISRNIDLRLAATVQASTRLLRLWNLGGLPYDVRFVSKDSMLVAATREGPIHVWNLAENTEVSTPGTTGVAKSFIASDASRAIELLREEPFARVLNVASGQWLPLQGAEEPLEFASFSPDGSQVAACGTRMGIWNADTGDPVPGPDIFGPLKWLGYTPDGSELLTINKVNEAELWSLGSGASRPLPVLIDPDYTEPEFSRDGRWLIAPSLQRLSVIDAKTLSVVSQSSFQFLLDINFAPNGKRHAVAAYRQQALMFETETGDSIAPGYQHESGAYRAVFSPDGRMLATAGFDNLLKLRKLAIHNAIAPAFHHGTLVDRIVFSDSGRFMATANNLGLIQVWDLAPRDLAYLPNARVTRGHPLVDGRILACTEGGTARFWDIEAERDAMPPLALPAEPAGVALSANAKIFGAAFGPGGAGFWELPGGRNTAMITNAGSIMQVFLSPDARLALLAASDGALVPIDPATGEILPFTTHGPGARTVAGWSGDGKWLATGWREVGDTSVELWNRQTGQMAGRVTGIRFGVWRLDFNPDSSRLLVAFNDRNMEPHHAQQYELPSLRPVGARMRHADGVNHALYSPDGRLIATGGQDNATRLWRAADGTRAGRELRHAGAVVSQHFSADGRLLATGGMDASARIWDTRAGELAAPPINVNSTVVHVEFSRNGRRLLMVDNAGNRPWIYKFDEAPVLTDEWEELAVCSSGLEAAPDGAGHPLEAEELAARFEKLSRQRPDLFAWPENSIPWHEMNASLAENQRDWTAAVFHLERLAKLSPQDSPLQMRLDAAKQALAKTP